MSGFGVFLLMLALVLSLVGLIKFLAWVDRIHEQGIHLPSFMSRRTDEGTQPEPEPIRSSHMNAAEPERTHGSGSEELVLNAAELAAVQRMIRHNASAVKPSKSSTIAAGFGVSRGGSAAYIRASLIYDALFGPPEPAVRYQPLTEESTPAPDRIDRARPVAR